MTTGIARTSSSSTGSTGWLPKLAGLALVLHGLIHGMGVALLLRLAEPGDLTYAVARPEPGTSLAVVFAILWALAGASFLVAGSHLIRGRRGSRTLVAASVLSLIAVGGMATVAPIGVAVSALTLSVGVWLTFRRQAPDRI